MEQHQITLHLDRIFEQTRFPVISQNQFKKLCENLMKSEQNLSQVRLTRKRNEWKKWKYCPSKFDNWYKLYFHLCTNHRAKLIDLMEAEQKGLIIKLICKNNNRILRYELQFQKSSKTNDITKTLTESIKGEVLIKVEPVQLNEIKIEHVNYNEFEATKLLFSYGFLS